MKTILRHTTSALASTSLLLTASLAMAGGPRTTAAYCGFDKTDSIDDYPNTGTLNLNGSVVIRDGSLELTTKTAAQNQRGTVFFAKPLDFQYTDTVKKLNRPFHTFFSFSISSNTNQDPVAGLALLIQNSDGEDEKEGSNFAGLGYGDIAPSVAIEFDSRKDAPFNSPDYPDPSGDHIGFMLDGNRSNHPAWYTGDDLPASFVGSSDGTLYVWIDYKGGDSQVLDLHFSKGKDKANASHIEWTVNDPSAFVSPAAFDPVKVLSAGTEKNYAAEIPGWVGFSAATYSGNYNTQSIHEWEFSDEGIPCKCQGSSACAGAAATPVCSETRGICVQCKEHKNCNLDTPVCNTVTERCEECPGDLIWHEESGKCVEECREGFTRNPVTGECVCPVGFTKDPTTEECVSNCTEAETWNPAVRRCDPKCTEDKTWNPATKTCDPKCAEDKTWNAATKTCDPRCTDKETWNAATKVCDPNCHPGWVRDKHNVCIADFPTPITEVGGCACSAAGSEPRDDSGTWLAVGLGAAAVIIRRRRSA